MIRKCAECRDFCNYRIKNGVCDYTIDKGNEMIVVQYVTVDKLRGLKYGEKFFRPLVTIPDVLVDFKTTSVDGIMPKETETKKPIQLACSTNKTFGYKSKMA